jgi:hypothetical protein
MVQGRLYSRLERTRLRATAAADRLVAEQGIPWHDALAFVALARGQRRTQQRTHRKG